MKTSILTHSSVSSESNASRGSVLIIALIFAAIIAISLGSYLRLSMTSLKLAHRTFLADSAVNLAETGLEEAVWMFNTMHTSVDTAANKVLWTNNGWTCNTTIGDAYITTMGSGYTSAPTVTISGGGGSGAQATAAISTAYIDGGETAITRVSSITITNAGTGYTSNPTITLSGGGGTGASAVARFAATRTLTFNNLEGGASGTVKVWVGGYNGTAVLPVVLAKATITPSEGAPVEKIVKVILSKNGILPKGVVSFDGITWNGRPLADSYLSSPTPGVPPFSLYDEDEARANTIVAALDGTINLGHGTVDGNVLTAPGVTVTGRHADISGQTIGNFEFPFTMPSAPTTYGYTDLTAATTSAPLPAVLPRPAITDPVTGAVIQAADVPAADGKYYYDASGQTIGALTVTAGKEVVIKGSSLNMVSGLQLAVSGSDVAKATIYMDGTISLSGNDKINAVAEPNANWAGSLDIYTTTTSPCTFSGNAKFYGCLTAPNSALIGNGGGHDQVDLCGSFVVGSVTSNGHMNFHYDEGLGSLTPAKAWGMSLWKEMQTASERALYADKLKF